MWRALELVSEVEDKANHLSEIATQFFRQGELLPPSTDASILSTPSKPARGIPSALPVLKEVSFNTSELICPVTSLLALELGTPAIEMLAQQVKLILLLSDKGVN